MMALVGLSISCMRAALGAFVADDDDFSGFDSEAMMPVMASSSDSLDMGLARKSASSRR